MKLCNVFDWKAKRHVTIVIEIAQQYFMYQSPGVMVVVTTKRNITVTNRFYSGRTLKKRYIWNKFGTAGHLIKTELCGKAERMGTLIFAWNEQIYISIDMTQINLWQYLLKGGIFQLWKSAIKFWKCGRSFLFKNVKKILKIFQRKIWKWDR
jgi:hypothetical protein